MANTVGPFKDLRAISFAKNPIRMWSSRGLKASARSISSGNITSIVPGQGETVTAVNASPLWNSVQLNYGSGDLNLTLEEAFDKGYSKLLWRMLTRCLQGNISSSDLFANNWAHLAVATPTAMRNIGYPDYLIGNFTPMYLERRTVGGFYAYYSLEDHQPHWGGFAGGAEAINFTRDIPSLPDSNLRGFDWVTSHYILEVNLQQLIDNGFTHRKSFTGVLPNQQIGSIDVGGIDFDLGMLVLNRIEGDEEVYEAENLTKVVTYDIRNATPGVDVGEGRFTAIGASNIRRPVGSTNSMDLTVTVFINGFGPFSHEGANRAGFYLFNDVNWIDISSVINLDASNNYALKGRGLNVDDDFVNTLWGTTVQIQQAVSDTRTTSNKSAWPYGNLDNVPGSDLVAIQGSYIEGFNSLGIPEEDAYCSGRGDLLYGVEVRTRRLRQNSGQASYKAAKVLNPSLFAFFSIFATATRIVDQDNFKLTFVNGVPTKTAIDPISSYDAIIDEEGWVNTPDQTGSEEWIGLIGDVAFPVGEPINKSGGWLIGGQEVTFNHSFRNAHNLDNANPNTTPSWDWMPRPTFPNGDGFPDLDQALFTVETFTREIGDEPPTAFKTTPTTENVDAFGHRSGIAVLRYRSSINFKSGLNAEEKLYFNGTELVHNTNTANDPWNYVEFHSTSTSHAGAKHYILTEFETSRVKGTDQDPDDDPVVTNNVYREYSFAITGYTDALGASVGALGVSDVLYNPTHRMHHWSEWPEVIKDHAIIWWPEASIGQDGVLVIYIPDKTAYEDARDDWHVGMRELFFGLISQAQFDALEATFDGTYTVVLNNFAPKPLIGACEYEQIITMLPL